VSLSETELIYLMAFVDGQVDDDELPEVTALLAKSEEARQIVAQQAALGDWVRESSNAHAASAGADRIAGHVLAEIEKLGGAKIIDLERERGRVTLNRQRVKEFGALLAVATVAAVFLLYPATNSGSVAVAPVANTPASSEPAPPPGSASSVAQASTPNPAMSGATASLSDSEGAGVDVQTVESPSHPFSIFYVPAATGLNAHSSSVVVWIGE
jgi:negative regulator of sigma E activity